MECLYSDLFFILYLRIKVMYNYTAKVIKVVDGDTIDVEIDLALISGIRHACALHTLMRLSGARNLVARPHSTS